MLKIAKLLNCCKTLENNQKISIAFKAISMEISIPFQSFKFETTEASSGFHTFNIFRLREVN